MAIFDYIGRKRSDSISGAKFLEPGEIASLGGNRRAAEMRAARRASLDQQAKAAADAEERARKEAERALKAEQRRMEMERRKAESEARARESRNQENIRDAYRRAGLVTQVDLDTGAAVPLTDERGKPVYEEGIVRRVVDGREVLGKRQSTGEVVWPEPKEEDAARDEERRVSLAERAHAIYLARAKDEFDAAKAQMDADEERIRNRIKSVTGKMPRVNELEADEEYRTLRQKFGEMEGKVKRHEADYAEASRRHADLLLKRSGGAAGPSAGTQGSGATPPSTMAPAPEQSGQPAAAAPPPHSELVDAFVAAQDAQAKRLEERNRLVAQLNADARRAERLTGAQRANAMAAIEQRRQQDLTYADAEVRRGQESLAKMRAQIGESADRNNARVAANRVAAENGLPPQYQDSGKQDGKVDPLGDESKLLGSEELAELYMLAEGGPETRSPAEVALGELSKMRRRGQISIGDHRRLYGLVSGGADPDPPDIRKARAEWFAANAPEAEANRGKLTADVQYLRGKEMEFLLKYRQDYQDRPGFDLKAWNDRRDAIAKKGGPTGELARLIVMPLQYAGSMVGLAAFNKVREGDIANPVAESIDSVKTAGQSAVAGLVAGANQVIALALGGYKHAATELPAKLGMPGVGEKLGSAITAIEEKTGRKTLTREEFKAAAKQPLAQLANLIPATRQGMLVNVAKNMLGWKMSENATAEALFDRLDSGELPPEDEMRQIASQIAAEVAKARGTDNPDDFDFTKQEDLGRNVMEFAETGDPGARAAFMAGLYSDAPARQMMADISQMQAAYQEPRTAPKGLVSRTLRELREQIGAGRTMSLMETASEFIGFGVGATAAGGLRAASGVARLASRGGNVAKLARAADAIDSFADTNRMAKWLETVGKMEGSGVIARTYNLARAGLLMGGSESMEEFVAAYAAPGSSPEDITEQMEMGFVGGLLFGGSINVGVGLARRWVTDKKPPGHDEAVTDAYNAIVNPETPVAPKELAKIRDASNLDEVDAISDQLRAAYQMRNTVIEAIKAGEVSEESAAILGVKAGKVDAETSARLLELMRESVDRKRALQVLVATKGETLLEVIRNIESQPAEKRDMAMGLLKVLNGRDVSSQEQQEINILEGEMGTPLTREVEGRRVLTDAGAELLAEAAGMDSVVTDTEQQRVERIQREAAETERVNGEKQDLDTMAKLNQELKNREPAKMPDWWNEQTSQGREEQKPAESRQPDAAPKNVKIDAIGKKILVAAGVDPVLAEEFVAEFNRSGDAVSAGLEEYRAKLFESFQAAGGVLNPNAAGVHVEDAGIYKAAGDSDSVAEQNAENSRRENKRLRDEANAKNAALLGQVRGARAARQSAESAVQPSEEKAKPAETSAKKPDEVAQKPADVAQGQGEKAAKKPDKPAKTTSKSNATPRKGSVQEQRSVKPKKEGNVPPKMSWRVTFEDGETIEVLDEGLKGKGAKARQREATIVAMRQKGGRTRVVGEAEPVKVEVASQDEVASATSPVAEGAAPNRPAAAKDSPNPPVSPEGEKGAGGETRETRQLEQMSPEDLGAFKQAEALKKARAELDAANRVKSKSDEFYAMAGVGGPKSKAELVRVKQAEFDRVLNSSPESFADIWDVAIDAARRGAPISSGLVDGLSDESFGSVASPRQQLKDNLSEKGYVLRDGQYVKSGQTREIKLRRDGEEQETPFTQRRIAHKDGQTSIRVDWISSSGRRMSHVFGPRPTLAQATDEMLRWVKSVNGVPVENLFNGVTGFIRQKIGAKVGMPARRAKAIADSVRKRLKTDIEVIVVDGAEGLPARDNGEMRDKDVAGVADIAQGRVWINAAAVQDAAHVREIVLHEIVGHIGFKAVATDLDVANLLRIVRGSKAAIASAIRSGADIEAIVLRDYFGGRRFEDLDAAERMLFLDEAIAAIAEIHDAAEGNANDAVQRVWDAIVDLVRAMLERVGFPAREISDERWIADLIRRSRRAVRGMGSRGAVSGSFESRVGAPVTPEMENNDIRPKIDSPESRLYREGERAGWPQMAARGFKNSPLSTYDDRLMAAREALWDAARTFDPNRKTSFERYARGVIRRRLIDSLRSGIRELDRERGTVRLDAPARAMDEEGRQTPAGENFPSPDVGPRESAAANEIADKVAKSLGELPERAKEVLTLLAKGMTFDEIGQRLGISRQAAQQMGARAIAAMRKKLESRGVTAETLEKRKEGERSTDEVLRDAVAEVSRVAPDSADVEAMRKRVRAERPPNRVTGRPDLANPGMTDAERQEMMAWQQAYSDSYETVKRDRAVNEAKVALLNDRPGTMAALLRKAASGEAFNEWEIHALRIVWPEEFARAEATGDPEDRRRSDALAYAWLKSGSAQATAFSARKDPQKGPAERYREYAVRMLHEPGKAVLKAIKAAPSPAQKAAEIRRIEALLAEARAAGDAARITALERQLEAAKAVKDGMEILQDEMAKIMGKVRAALARDGISLEDLAQDKMRLYLKLSTANVKGTTLLRDEIKDFSPSERRALELMTYHLPDWQIAGQARMPVGKVTALRARFVERLWQKHRAKYETSPVDGSAVPVDQARRLFIDDMARSGFVRRGRRPIDIYDPVDFRRLARVVGLARGEFNLADLTYELFVNNILFAISTSARNLASVGYGASRLTVNWLTEAVLNDVIFKQPGAAHLAEFRHMWRAIGPTIQEAFQNAAMAFMTEETTIGERYLGEGPSGDSPIFDKDQVRGTIPGKFGRFARIPSRALLAADDAMKTIFGNIMVGAHAYRVANVLRANGDISEEQMADIIEMEIRTPGSDSWNRAIRDARKWTFTSEMARSVSKADMEKNSSADVIGGIVDVVFGAIGTASRIRTNMVIPDMLLRFAQGFVAFIRTPLKFTQEGVRTSMAGSLPLFADALRFLRVDKHGNLEWRGGDAADAIEQFAEQLIAWALFGTLIFRATEGDDDDGEKWLLLTDMRASGIGGPDRKGERQLMMADGEVPPGSMLVRAGGREVVVEYRYIEPLATTLGLMVGASRSIKQMRAGAPAEEAMKDWQARTWALFENKLTLRGVADFTKMISGQISFPEVVADRFIATFIPPVMGNLVRQPMRSADPFVRDTRTEPMSPEVLKYKILPSSKTSLPPKVDVIGEEIRRRPGMVAASISPAPFYGLGERDQLRAVIVEWNKRNPDARYAPEELDSKLWSKRTGVEVEMTPQEKHDFLMEVGQRWRDEAQPILDRIGDPKDATKEDIERLKDLRGSISKKIRARWKSALGVE